MYCVLVGFCLIYIVLVCCCYNMCMLVCYIVCYCVFVLFCVFFSSVLCLICFMVVVWYSIFCMACVVVFWLIVVVCRICDSFWALAFVLFWFVCWFVSAVQKIKVLVGLFGFVLFGRSLRLLFGLDNHWLVVRRFYSC